MNATEVEPSEPSIVRYIKFYLFILLQIPSVCVSIYIIYNIFISYNIRSRINNHSILLLVIISLIEVTTELSITLEYLFKGTVGIKTNSFCLFWIWFNFSLQIINLMLMSWMCIQRHILVFHRDLVVTFNGKLKWHYIPLTIAIIYPSIFYLICVIIYQCENFFDYSSLLCGSICYNNVNWLSSLDWITNILIPSLIIPVSSILLLIQFLIQSKKMKRLLTWKSSRRLTLQVLGISILYFILWVPLSLVSLIRIYFNQSFLQDITFYYLNYTPYLVQLLMPFICLACLPELWKRNNQVQAARALH